MQTKANTAVDTDEALFQSIKEGRYELIDKLYVGHRDAFVTYATQRLYATEEDACDCFQDAVIAFYKNTASGKLTELSCSIRTYLFAVGKRLVYRRNQKRNRERSVDHEEGRVLADDPANELDLSLMERFEDDHRRQLLAQALGKLGENCQRILTLFYYHHYPIESIQENLNYSSPGAVRIKKMRCLDKLKQLLLPLK